MKKTVRILCLILAMGMCLSLCGCSYLDELRESWGVRLADGTIRLPDGTEYRALPEQIELAEDIYYNNYDNVIYVAEEDVPLLLISLFGEYFVKSKDGQFLVQNTEHSVMYYCRTDVYDGVMARIRSGITTELYGYEYYDEETDQYLIYKLTKKQAEAIELVLSSKDAEILPENVTLDVEDMADLYLYSDDLMFRQDTVDIFIAQGIYYIADYTADTYIVYTVPESLSSVFAGIFARQGEVYV